MKRILILSIAGMMMVGAQAFAQSSTSCTGTAATNGSSCWTCGTNCLAVLDSDGVMTISAKNEATNVYMEDHSDGYHWGSAKDKIKEVIIGDGISYVGRGAFRWASNLESVEMSSSVKTIGSQSFDSTNISLLKIPNSVTSIGGWSFFNSNLTSVTIPSSITKIDEEAFRDNLSLSEVTFEGDVSKITFGPKLFRGTSDDLAIYYQESDANRIALENMLKKANKNSTPKGATLMAYTLDENGQKILSKGYKYDSNGNLVEEYVYSPDGRSYQKYSANGTLLGKFNADGTAYHEVKRIYTVSEAEKALGKNNKNTFSIRYR